MITKFLFPPRQSGLDHHNTISRYSHETCEVLPIISHPRFFWNYTPCKSYFSKYCFSSGCLSLGFNIFRITSMSWSYFFLHDLDLLWWCYTILTGKHSTGFSSSNPHELLQTPGDTQFRNSNPGSKSTNVLLKAKYIFLLAVARITLQSVTILNLVPRKYTRNTLRAANTANVSKSSCSSRLVLLLQCAIILFVIFTCSFELISLLAQWS